MARFADLRKFKFGIFAYFESIAGFNFSPLDSFGRKIFREITRLNFNNLAGRFA